MFVHVVNKDEREMFINSLLELEGVKINNDKNFSLTKEEIINSIFPISIDLDKLEIDCLKNITCAAAAMSNKSYIKTPEEAIEMIKEKIKNKTK